MRKILLLSVVMLTMLATQAWAQQRTITGTVTSAEDGLGVPGVSIVVKGTQMGTVTDFNGQYTLMVPGTAEFLVFSFVGLQTQEILIGDRTLIDVVMQPDYLQMDEVMVVAYGTATRGTFTGAATVVGSQKIEARPIANVTQAIEGQTPGVQVTSASGQPGSGQAIRIRGFGSINYSNEPLYVVDGVPYDLNINNINPNDIESITVLKDAASTSLYGNRAANGVIMITTKKGTKDRSSFQIRATQGYSTRGLPEYDRIGMNEYYPIMWEAYRNSLMYRASNPLTPEDASIIASGTWPVRNASNLQVHPLGNFGDISQQLLFNPYNIAPNQIVQLDGQLNPNAKANAIYSPEDLDWENEITRLGDRKEYSVVFSGGSERNDYYVSLGYLDDKGFLIKSDFKRYTARININSQPKNWLKTGLNLAANRSESQTARDDSNTGYVNPFFFSRNIGAIYPVYGIYQFGNSLGITPGTYAMDDAGNKIYDYGQINGIPSRAASASPGRHIVAETNFNEDLLKRNVISARTFGEFTLMKGLTFTTNISLDVNAYNFGGYDNRLVGDGAPAGRARRTNSLTTSSTFNQLLNYNKSFGLHNFDVLLGHESYSYEYNYLYGFRQEIIVDGITELVNFATTNSLTSYTDEYRTEGYFSRLNYDYDGKYFISGSFRRDGSSKFYKDARWGNFFSVGLAWRMDKESFIADQTWIDMLKFRASYGQVGNDAVGYYAWQALYALGYNNANVPGFVQQKLAGTDLKWESNNNWGIGLDYGIFNRFVGTIEYYNRESVDLLFAVPLPVSSGILSETRNIGAVSNSGIEFRIASDIVQTKDFNWNLDLNFSTVKNVIKKLPDDQQEIISGTKKLMEGRSIYDFWLRQWYGVDPDDGRALYFADDTQAASDIRIIGSDTLTTDRANALYAYSGTAIPDLFGGITNTFRYKNLELSVLISYQIGGEVYDGSYANLMAIGSYGGAFHSDILNRWQQQGDVTDVPRLDQGDPTNLNAATSTRWLVDASYLNLRAINLYYNLPKSIAQKLSMQNVRAYVSAENLGLLSARKGMNVNQFYSGTTGNYYSPARTITLGLNVTL
jgi:TonB-linked SusC/RagA family outer membrane protein